MYTKVLLISTYGDTAVIRVKLNGKSVHECLNGGDSEDSEDEGGRCWFTPDIVHPENSNGQNVYFESAFTQDELCDMFADPGGLDEQEA